MPVQGSDFLNFAINIHSTASTEIEFRNVMSRSYYTMYHSALEILDNAPPSYVGQGSHASLSTYLESNDETYDSRSLIALSYMLKQYKAKRCIADYVLSENVTKEQATESLNAAKRFTQKCNELAQQKTV